MSNRNPIVTNAKSSRGRATFLHSEWWKNPGGVEVVTNPRLRNLKLLASVNSDSQVELYAHVVESSLCVEGELEDAGDAKWLIAKNWEHQKLFDGRKIGSLNPPMLTYPMEAEFDDLHNRFAALQSESAIVKFASKHGFLERSLWGMQVDGYDASDGGSIELTFGESLAYWRLAIKHVQTLVALSRCLRAKASDDLVREIVQSDGKSVWLDCELWQKDDLNLVQFPIHTKVRLPDDSFDEGHKSAIQRAATHLLEKHMNYALASFASARIRCGPTSDFSLVPTCLLGAIYVHLALEIMGKSKPPVRCAGCGKWISIEGGKRRHCDSACKQIAYRRRKGNA